MNDDFISEDFTSIEEPQPTTGSKKKTIIIVVIAVAVLCCCFGVFLYTGYYYWGDMLLEYLGY